MEKMDGIHFYLVLFNLKFKAHISLYLKIDPKLYSLIVDEYKVYMYFYSFIITFF